jgi:hypothetical protein
MAKLDQERELEEYLYKLTQNESPYFEPADEVYTYIFRQFKIDSYGTADLIYMNCGYHDDLRLHIVELKKGPIDLAALTQIARYRQGIKHHLSLIYPDEKNRPELQVTGSLIGDSMKDGINYLIDSIPWLDCYTFKLSLESGVEFFEQCQQGDDVHWHRTDAKPANLKKFNRIMMREFAQSKREFLKWQKDWDAQKQQSNVVEFKK